MLFCIDYKGYSAAVRSSILRLSVCRFFCLETASRNVPWERESAPSQTLRPKGDLWGVLQRRHLLNGAKTWGYIFKIAAGTLETLLKQSSSEVCQVLTCLLSTSTHELLWTVTPPLPLSPPPFPSVTHSQHQLLQNELWSLLLYFSL